MSGKDKLSTRKQPFGKEVSIARRLASRTTHPTAVYFHYTKQNFGIPSNTKTAFQLQSIETDNLRKYQKGILEEEIASMTVSKSISSASGSFSLSLFPTQNWKAKLSAGDWILIYMNDQYGGRGRYEGKNLNSKNLLIMGNIDRVSRSLTKNEDTDKIELRYVVSGKNFGKVFEKTDIWYDPYANQEKTLDIALINAGLEIQGNPSDMCEKLVNVFLKRGGEFPTGRTPDLNNWVMPSEIVSIMNATTTGTPTPDVTNPRFADVLNLEIEPDLPGFKARQMLTLNSNGSLHEMLKRSSNDVVNELFYEEVRDSGGFVKPTMVLRNRPINTPFFSSHFGFSGGAPKQADVDKAVNAINNKITTMQDLAKTSFIEISPAEVKYEDLGRDDHSKFNMWWLRTTNNYEHAFSMLSNLNKKNGIANPTIIRGGVQRDGLRRFEQTLEFCYRQGTDKKTAIQGVGPNIELFTGFMAQLYDMHFANHLYDGGTITTSGVLEAELGKALILLPDPNYKAAQPKAYYIEGYEHEWSFPKHWTTTWTVSHGQFKTNTQNIFIDSTTDDNGAPDTLLDNVYLAKTKTGRN